MPLHVLLRLKDELRPEERARLLTWSGEPRRERSAGAYDYRHREPTDDAPGGVVELRVYLGAPERIVQTVLKAASDQVGYPLIARAEYETV